MAKTTTKKNEKNEKIKSLIHYYNWYFIKFYLKLYIGTNTKPDEVEIYKYATEILRPTEAVLKSLKQYTGCGELIRKAISTPNRQNEEEAWNALCPSVSKLKDYYEFAKKIAEAFPQLLKKLCTGNVENNLRNYQTVLKCFGDVLHFVSQWDDLKVIFI